MNQKTIDYRKQVAEEFVKALEEDPLQWKKTWNTGVRGIPVNATNSRRYSGINNLYLRLLMEKNKWQDPRFATFNQIKKEGWHLQKGAKGVQVEYWMPIDPNENKAISWEAYAKLTEQEKEKIYVRAKYFYVFNAKDIEGIPPLPEPDFKDGITADQLIDKISENMDVEIINDGGNRSFYRPSEDKIHMPLAGYFDSSEAYNSVLLHELTHATGASTRLNRDMRGMFGSDSYAYEELVAEISSAYMAAELSEPIPVTSFEMENHKAYVQGWISAIEDKPETLFKALKDAEKASNYLCHAAELITDKEYERLSQNPDMVTKQDKPVPKKTLNEFLGEKGLSSPISDYMLDKMKIPHGLSQRQEAKLQKEAFAAAQEYQERRSDAIREYNSLKETGKLQDKTPVEKSLDTAAGHPDNASVQSARRMLEKRGIDWESELIKREFKTCGYLATDKTVSHMKNITKETGSIKLKDVEEMYKGIRPVSPEVKADVEAIAMDCRAQEMARAAVNCL